MKKANSILFIITVFINQELEFDLTFNDFKNNFISPSENFRVIYFASIYASFELISASYIVFEWFAKQINSRKFLLLNR